MQEDIILEATGKTDGLENAFKGARETVEREMEDAQRAVERLDLGVADGIAESFGEKLAAGSLRALDAIGKLVDQFSRVATSASDAAKAMLGVGDADAELDRAVNTVRDLADAHGALADAGQESAKASKTSAEDARISAEALALLSDETRNAADAGTDAGKRIRDAMEGIVRSTEKVAEGVRAADLAFDALGNNPGALIGAANNDFERAGVLLADIAKGVRDLDAASRSGLDGFAQRAERVSQRVAELEDVLERQGDRALPAVRQELERLRKQYRATFDEGAKRAVQLEASIDDQKEALERLRVESQGAAAGAVDVAEAIEFRFPSAAKAIDTAVSAFAAFKLGFDSTREFIEFLERDFGVSIDKFATEVLGIQEAADGIVGANESLATQLERVRNQLDVLRGAGTDVSELEARWAELTGTLEKAREALRSTDLGGVGQAVLEQKAAIEAVGQLVDEAADAWDAYAAANQRATEKANAADAALRDLEERALGAKVDDLAEEYRGLANAFVALKDRADDLRGSPVLERFVDEADTLRRTLEGMPDELAELFEQATGSKPETAVRILEGMADALGVVSTRQREVAEDAREAAEATADAWSKAADETRGAWEKVEATLLGLVDAGEAAAPDGTAFDQGLDRSLERVAELERQLDELRSKSVISLDDANLETALLDQLARARQELATLSNDPVAIPATVDGAGLAASARTAGEDASAALREVLGSSGFVDAFTALRPAVQTEVAAIVAQLDGLLEAGARLDAADIASYGAAIRDALGGEASAAADQLVGALGGLTTSGSDTVTQLLEIASASRRAADDAAAAAQPLTSLGSGVAAAGEASSQAAVEIRKTADGVEILNTAADQLQRSAPQASSALEGLGGAGDQAADGVRKASEAAEEAQGASASAADGFQRAGDAADAATVRIEGTGEAVRVVQKSAEEMAATAPSATAALNDLGAAGEAVTGPLQAVGLAAGSAGDGLQRVADAASQIAAAEDAPARLVEMGEASAGAVEPVEAVAVQAVALAEAVVRLVEDGAELPEQIRGWVEGLGELRPVLEELNGGALAVHREQLEATGDAYERTRDAAAGLTLEQSTFAESLAAMEQGLDAVEAELDDQVDALGEVAAAVESLGESIATMKEDAEAAAESLGKLASPETLANVNALTSALGQAAGEASRLADELLRADAAQEQLAA